MTTNISKAQLARIDAYGNIVGLKEAVHGDETGPTEGALVIPSEIEIVSVSLRDPTGTYLLYSDGAGGITEIDASGFTSVYSDPNAASAPAPVADPSLATTPVAPASEIVVEPALAATPVPATPVATEAPVAVPAATPTV